ncbi:MAG: HD domain-containing protein [Burkholderiaceae bacterium]|jgi:predicted HD phosphohydrolase
MTSRATFVHMRDSTREHWQVIGGEFKQFAGGLAQRVAAHLQLLEGDYGGFPVDRLTHSLQTATRALHAGRDDEYVVCALLHDIGDTLGSYNHPDIAAAIVKPFVSDANHWMVQHHGIFQGHYFFHHIGLDRDMRDQFQAHPHYERTAEFCELFDGPAFDAHAQTLPIGEFMPILQRVMAQPKRSIYKADAPAEAAGHHETRLR